MQPTWRRFGAGALVLAGISLSAIAQDNSITIGASVPLSGPQGEAGKEGLAIMQAQIDAFNRQGGVGTRQLVLKVLDDGYDPQRAADNTRRLLQEGVVAMVNCWGTTNCSAMLPELQQQGQTSLVGTIAGAGAARQQPGRLVYPLRATTEVEVQGMARHMKTLQQQRIAVVYQNDAFGKDSLKIALAALQSQGLAALTEIAVEASGSNAAEVSKKLAGQQNLHSVIVLAGASATVATITETRKAHVSAHIYNLAAQANSAVVKGLGQNTHGLMFSTLVPSPWRASVPAVKDYQNLLTHSGMPAASYLGLEVYLNLRTLLDALGKSAITAHTNVSASRAALMAALDGAGEIRYGAMSLRFAPPRMGSSYVGLAMVDSNGQFRE